MTITACLVVRNENHHIFQCFKSIWRHVDEIIMLDTGSTDGTLNLDWLYDRLDELQQDGPLAMPPVIMAEWPWRDDFAAARNESIGYAQSDWILAIDADERLEGDIQALVAAAPADVLAYAVDVRSIFSTDLESLSPQIRLYRNHQGFAYHGRVHEQLQTADGQDVPRQRSDIVFRHIGYDQRGITVLGGKQVTGPERLEGKKDRNRRLLDMGLAEEPDNPRYWFERMREHLREDQNVDAFHAGTMCLELWSKTGEQREYISPLLEYLLDCGRRAGLQEDADRVWRMVPSEYRTNRAWQLYAITASAALG